MNFNVNYLYYKKEYWLVDEKRCDDVHFQMFIDMVLEFWGYKFINLIINKYVNLSFSLKIIIYSYTQVNYLHVSLLNIFIRFVSYSKISPKFILHNAIPIVSTNLYSKFILFFFQNYLLTSNKLISSSNNFSSQLGTFLYFSSLYINYMIAVII